MESALGNVNAKLSYIKLPGLPFQANKKLLTKKQQSIETRKKLVFNWF